MRKIICLAAVLFLTVISACGTNPVVDTPSPTVPSIHTSVILATVTLEPTKILPTKAATAPVEPTLIPTQIPTTIHASTAQPGWNTYVNDYLGYQISYPPSMKIHAEGWISLYNYETIPPGFTFDEYFTYLHGIMLIDVVTAMLAIVPLLFVIIPQPKRSEAAQASGGLAAVWGDVRVGFRYIWSWPGMMLLGAIAAVLNLLFNPAFSLMPILVTKHFNGGALQLAWLEAAWGFGTIAGGLLLGIWGGFKRKIITSLAGLVLLGLSMGLIGLVPSWGLPLVIALAFLVGFSNPIVNGPLFAVLQNVVAPDMQGRVFTLIGSVAGAMSPIGLLLACFRRPDRADFSGPAAGRHKPRTIPRLTV